MGRAKKTKATLGSIVFSTPEQKLLKFLLTECTTEFTPRVLSSKLKGVRGLGGAEGIKKILKTFSEIGIIRFIDNNRAVCVQNDLAAIQILKSLVSLCELEGLADMLEPVSSKGILFGSRSNGQSRSDSDYDLFVVSENLDEIEKIVNQHPLGKRIEVVVWDSDSYHNIEKKDSNLFGKLSQGIVMWGPNW